jgi:branched-chain amino acid transport system substrate-binding protein
VHYAYDTYALANIAGKEIVKGGGDTVFHHRRLCIWRGAGEGHVRGGESCGGKVLGASNIHCRRPTFRRIAAGKASRPRSSATNAGGDTINSIKSASEFGITERPEPAALLAFITGIRARP